MGRFGQELNGRKNNGHSLDKSKILCNLRMPLLREKNQGRRFRKTPKRMRRITQREASGGIGTLTNMQGDYTSIKR